MKDEESRHYKSEEDGEKNGVGEKKKRAKKTGQKKKERAGDNRKRKVAPSLTQYICNL